MTAPVVTPPAEVLNQVLAAVAAASGQVHVNLMECQSCRNRLLYVLDTAPYSGDSLLMITRRLRALPQDHDLSHRNPDAVNHGDLRPPHIRWIAS